MVLGFGYSTIKKLILVLISIKKIKTRTKPNLVLDNPLVIIPKLVGYESITHDYRFHFRSKKL